jgi:hypothetical protein
MLDPSRLRIELAYLGVSAAANPPARIDDENRRAGSSLVDGKYHLRHRRNSPAADIYTFPFEVEGARILNSLV